MKTLEELRDYINANEDWMPEVNEVIRSNGWIDETDEKYGICNDGKNMIGNTYKQLEEIFKDELLQMEVITTERGKIMRFLSLDAPDVWEAFNKDGVMRKGTIYECLTFLYPSEIK